MKFASTEKWKTENFVRIRWRKKAETGNQSAAFKVIIKRQFRKRNFCNLKIKYKFISLEFFSFFTFFPGRNLPPSVIDGWFYLFFLLIFYFFEKMYPCFRSNYITLPCVQYTSHIHSDKSQFGFDNVLWKLFHFKHSASTEVMSQYGETKMMLRCHKTIIEKKRKKKRRNVSSWLCS